MMQAMREQPQIVIVRVEGVASAAGCQLVANADLAIASRDARFATPGVNIGLWCLTPMVALSRAVAPKHALQMLATGRLYDADFALKIGLVNEVVAPELLDETINALAAEIASKSTYTLALGKQAFYRQLQMPVPTLTNMRGSWWSAIWRIPTPGKVLLHSLRNASRPGKGGNGMRPRELAEV